MTLLSLLFYLFLFIFLFFPLLLSPIYSFVFYTLLSLVSVYILCSPISHTYISLLLFYIFWSPLTYESPILCFMNHKFPINHWFMTVIYVFDFYCSKDLYFITIVGFLFIFHFTNISTFPLFCFFYHLSFSF